MQPKSRNILVPTIGLCFIIFVIGILIFKKIFRYRRPITPYKEPPLAIITQTCQQQQQKSYQTVWPPPPPPPVEQPPPPYYTVMIPPSMSYVKQ